MKKLQNDFTTPEQSKKLLELGVPADSADCFYINDGYTPNFRDELYEHNTGHKFPFSEEGFTPCWSVGRLMEIFEVCTGIVWENAIIEGYTKIDMLIEDFDARHVSMDFSKLED